MDLNEFTKASVAGLPLVLVVLGLVYWLGKMGVKGKAQLISSMLIGLIFGGAYQISLAMPVGFAGWFAVVVYGIGLGLVASGVYEVGKEVAAKALKQ